MRYKEWISSLPAYKPAKLISNLPKGIVKLSSNENPLGPSPRAMEAIQSAAIKLYRYPDSEAVALRQSLAEHAAMPIGSVICGNGSDELIFLLSLAFLEPGDEAVMSHGTFISYLLRTREMGATPVQVPLRDYTHDLAAMAAAITPKTRIMFVCNPNNPTGTANTADEMHMLLEQVPDDVLVVVDEAYIEYVTMPNYPDLLPEIRNGRSNIIVLRTCSKIYGLAGLRIGYGYAHPELVSYLNRVRTPFNVNTLAQEAGLAAVKDVIHVARSRAHTLECNEYFTHELTTRGIAFVPTQANFIAIHVGDDMAVTEAIMQRGFTVTPLSGWGIPGIIRVTFGTEEQNKQFISVLTDILQQHQ